MILMSMSDKEALDLIDVLLKISDIRDNLDRSNLTDIL
jgi:hypothetical protein